MLRNAEGDLATALPAFTEIFRGLGKITSYENALNIYVCTLTLRVGALTVYLAPGEGRNSELCRA